MSSEFREVAEIIQQVNATSSKIDKESIIALHKDNAMLGNVLNHIFNPYIKTNIAKKKLAKETKSIGLGLGSIDEYMNYLAQCTGKDSDIATVQAYISSQDKDLWWLLEAMATKTLKIGATVKTINKAFGYDFIPSFDVMLAEKYIDSKKVKSNGKMVRKAVENWRRYVDKRVIATKKLDGNRCVVFVNEDGTVKLYSREGHVMDGFIEIEDAFASFPIGFVYDGEILATNEEGLNSKDLFQKTSKIIKRKGNKLGVEFFAFDIVPIKEFEQGGWSVACEKRKQALSDVVKQQSHDLVHYVEPLYIGMFDKEKIESLSDDARANEEEGIMIQLADVGYECKRTFSIMKVKIMQSADIRCLDVYEGKSGKNIGKLGGIVCDFKGHRVNVGGGFSDELRESIWKDPSIIIGQIVEIQYFEEFEDENEKLDLRFAGFKTIRTDKSEPSYH